MAARHMADAGHPTGFRLEFGYVPAAQRQPRVLFECPQLQPAPPGQRYVVAVHPRHQPVPAALQPFVQRPGQPTVLLQAHHLEQPRVPRLKGRDRLV